MRRRSFLVAVALLVAVLPACSHNPEPKPEGPPPKSTMLRVNNQNFYDMEIFLVRFGSRTRLGLAPGNSSTNFEFPSQFLQSGTGTVRFEAHPVGATGRAFTEDLTVQPGDVVGVDILP
ncbi:MAG TPA: hypothetical protein VL287_04055 [Gemmatimonadales bacterium]|jgi:hypothetical protein|nr:hypothetical protein [Gemmatimonadales bacterium]